MAEGCSSVSISYPLQHQLLPPVIRKVPRSVGIDHCKGHSVMTRPQAADLLLTWQSYKWPKLSMQTPARPPLRSSWIVERIRCFHGATTTTSVRRSKQGLSPMLVQGSRFRNYASGPHLGRGQHLLEVVTLQNATLSLNLLSRSWRSGP